MPSEQHEDFENEIRNEQEERGFDFVYEDGDDIDEQVDQTGFGFVFTDGNDQDNGVEEDVEDLGSVGGINANVDEIAPTDLQPQVALMESWLYRSRFAVNESEKEFRYFQSFIELGSGRSISYISQLFNLQESTVYSIYKKNNWKVRARDYDRYMLAEKIKLSKDARQEEHLRKLEVYRQEQELIGKQLSLNAAKIAQVANRKLTKMLESNDEMLVRDLPGMLNAAAKLADIGKQLQSSALGVDQLMVALEEADID